MMLTSSYTGVLLRISDTLAATVVSNVATSFRGATDVCSLKLWETT